jgi:hypothetical protein
MKRILALFSLIIVCAVPALCQRTKKKPAPLSNQPRTIAKDAPVPTGFVVIAQTTTSKTIKKPSARETVCDGSPIPEGYTVLSQTGSASCADPDMNPLANALVIARDDLAQSKTETAQKDSTQDNDDEESEPRVTIRVVNGNQSTKEKPKSILEQRAEEEHDKAQRALAARDHKVMIGMTPAQVLEAWGRPNDITRSTSPDAERETWIYYNSVQTGYVYFTNGKVTDWTIRE